MQIFLMFEDLRDICINVIASSKYYKFKIKKCMFLTLKTYNFNYVQHKVTYHKNVLSQERHELSMQVFHGTEIVSALLV